MKNTANETIHWWLPFSGEREKDLVLEVLNLQYLNEGEYVDRFETRVKELLGVKYAVATTSGTAALFLSLKAVGIGPGDEVIVPDITFIATANAVKLAGAKPVFVDVDALTSNMDPYSIRKAVTKATKALLPVHVSGRAADLTEIQQIANELGLSVVEDAAEAFTSNFKGRALGTFGKTGCFSFSPNKTITTGQGGMVVTNDETIYQRLKELKDHGRPIRGTGGDDTHHSVGFNFKMTNLQAAVGLGQLDRLKERQKKMRQIYETYQERLSPLKSLTFFGFAAEEVPQWTDVQFQDRDALVHYLKQHGVHCRNFWHPLHTQKPYRQNDDEFPVSMKVAYEAFWLPSSFQMTESQQQRVCDLICRFISQHFKKAA